jgi:hypothetical protein
MTLVFRNWKHLNTFIGDADGLWDNERDQLSLVEPHTEWMNDLDSVAELVTEKVKPGSRPIEWPLRVEIPDRLSLAAGVIWDATEFTLDTE